MCNFKHSSSHIKKVKLILMFYLTQYIYNIILKCNKIEIFHILFHTKSLKSSILYFKVHLSLDVIVSEILDLYLDLNYIQLKK